MAVVEGAKSECTDTGRTVEFATIGVGRDADRAVAGGRMRRGVIGTIGKSGLRMVS